MVDQNHQNILNEQKFQYNSDEAKRLRVLPFLIHESPKTPGTGYSILPCDGGALADRLDILLPSFKAENKGLRNNLIVFVMN